MKDIRFTRIMRRWSDQEIVGINDDGTIYERAEWTAREDAIASQCAKRHGLADIHELKDDRALGITDPDIVRADGDGRGDGENGGDGRFQDNDDSGDGQDSGDGDGSQGDESDEQSDSESGSGDGEDGGDGGDPDIQFEESEGEDDPFPDNPLLDDIWPDLKPRVVQIAESRATQAFQHGVRYTRQHAGSGGGSGSKTVRVSGKKTGEIAGVQHFMFDTVLRAVARGLHVYLPGPPGTGKSHMAVQVAEALGVEIHIDSFSPMSTTSKLDGFVDANGKVVETGYRRAFVNGWVYVGDELDNANPAIVTGLNSGLANGRHAFPDGTFQMHDRFVMIATANTLGTGPTSEFAGRQKLDPATLNRFVKIPIGTDEGMEQALVESILGAKQADRWLSKVRHARRAVEGLGIRHFVTMRDSLNGARLIAAGDGAFTVTEALDMTVMNVLSEDQQAKIKAYR